MAVSCFICYHVFDIMLSFLFDFLFTVFFTTVKTLPWTARSKECYWLVGVFENRVVKKNTFKAPESCSSRRTDSLEWCKVENTRKNRGGTGESASLSLPPLPSPTLFFFFYFSLLCRFIFRAVPNYLNVWNTPKTPSAPLSSCHLKWSTQVTYWNWLHVSVTSVLLSAYSTVARSIALPLVRSCCLCLVLSFFLFFCLLICFWSFASLLSVCQLFISITSLFQVLTPRSAQSGNSCRYRALAFSFDDCAHYQRTKQTILQFLFLGNL